MAKRFKWRLETVKNVKEREEEQCQLRLADARRLLAQEEARLAALQEKRKALMGELREKQSGALDTAKLATINAYLEQLADQAKQQAERVEASRSDAQKRQEELLKSVQENRVLDNLRERDLQSYRKEERKRDQTAMDETANRRDTDPMA